eukprot:6191801-Pleurochrysis_carterae.AAC.1
MTLAVGQVKDNAPGLRVILGDGVSFGIGADFLELQQAGVVWVDIVEDGSEWTLVNYCQPVGCLDLAAARGMRASRGKSACLCACHGAAALQAYPGCETVLPIPSTGTSLATWREAEAVIAGFCSYDSDLMSYESLEAAGHVPPTKWDFETDGAWSCMHCQSVVWRSRAEFEAAKAELNVFAMRAADDDDAAQKTLDTIMREHAKTHLDATYLCAPVVRVGTSFFVVDPMHCLQLNVAKTCWKYSVGDRMLEHHRGRVAEYLGSIDRPLDLRTEGERNPDQKWFSASSFDHFVTCSTSKKGKSPGLAANVWAIVERVFDSSLPSASPAAAASTTSSSSAPVPPHATSSAGVAAAGQARPSRRGA